VTIKTVREDLEPKGMKELSESKRRILSALVLAPLAILIILQGSPYFQIMLAVLGLAMIMEWTHLVTGYYFHLLASAVIINLTLLLILPQLFIWAVLPIFFLQLAMIYYGFECCSSRVAGLILGGSFYIFLSCAAFLYLPAPEIITILALVWSNDIGAYYFGRKYGVAKLCPGISPNKTWVGFLAGIVIGSLTGYISAQLFGLEKLAGYSLIPFVMVLSFVANGGDLLESAFKRYFGVKDSGNLMPGHGGILDRMDSLLGVGFTITLLNWLGGLFTPY
jgi:phosphatidate cytidylyltransferase